MEFNDDKHLENFLNKANREGKKIIGHEILSEPCVYIVPVKEGMPKNLPIKYAREYGTKMTIEKFQQMCNDLEVIKDGYVVFDNIKSE